MSDSDDSPPRRRGIGMMFPGSPGPSVQFRVRGGGDHPLYGSVQSLSMALQDFFQLQHLRRLREALNGRIEMLQSLAAERQRLDEERQRWMEMPTLDDVLLRRALAASLEEQQPCGPPPASKEDIAKLIAHRITSWDLAQPESTRECAVCLEPFVKGNLATRLPCRHIFCPECIRGWLERHGTCPTCRAAVKDLPSPRIGKLSNHSRQAAAAAAEAAPAPASDPPPPPSPMSGTPVQGLMQRMRAQRGSAEQGADPPQRRAASPPCMPSPRAVAEHPAPSRRTSAATTDSSLPSPRPPPEAAQTQGESWGRRPSRGPPGGGAAEGQQTRPIASMRGTVGRRRGEDRPAAGSGTAWARGTTAGLGTRH
eukprot:TRINITY_DN46985_c0_g1_i1.p2 TRINITY_DN46985_c0_g1~~TRINITY_DN46985_c0_g1_i1.p2  ORF type:complete len:367 (+),score=103.88 TRINITY_DN46985_c0_g1_i1:104-1204(+)